jgi:hypothetical protein
MTDIAPPFNLKEWEEHYNLKFKLASSELFDNYFSLKCDLTDIYWSGHLSKPDKEELRRWWLNQISSTTRVIILFYFIESIIGYLYIDTDNKNAFEISYGVKNSHAKRRFGTAMVKFSKIYIANKIQHSFILNAWISDLNLSSIKCVERNMFRKTSRTQIRVINNSNHVFHLYEKEVTQ